LRQAFGREVMRIQWLGQASFQITTSDGVAIRTDPYDSSLGFRLSSLPADVVTVSHDHFDHAAVDTVPGDPVVLRRAGEREVKGVTFLGVESFHDDNQGLDRGTNIIFVIEAEGVRVCHLGDLGHTLTQQQVEAIGHVDVLMVPVGGVYTVDAAGATSVMAQLSPRITIPMHYRVNGLSLAIGGVGKFLRGKPNVHTHVALEVTGDSMPAETQVVVLTLAARVEGS